VSRIFATTKHGRTGHRKVWSVAALALLMTTPITAQMMHHRDDGGPHMAPDYSPKASVANRTPYDLGIRVTRADGRVVDLATLKGRPTIMTMFFASCPDVCPLMTEHIQQMERKIPARELRNLQVVFVSFDERDKPSVLQGYRGAHGIESPRWTVATASPADSRALGDFLGVRFQKLPNGSFSHTAMIDLLAADGAVLARVPAPSLVDPQFSVAVRAMLSMPATRASRNKS